MKRNDGILIAIGFLLIQACAPNAWSQGRFVRHGFQVSMPDVAIGSERSQLAFRAGYHIQGVIELGLGLERRSDFEDDIVSVSLSPMVAAYPIRQSSTVPFTVRLGVVYETLNLSGDPITALEEQGVLSDGQAWRWEGGISRRIPLDGTLLGFPLVLYPVVDVSYRSVAIDQGSESRRDQLTTVDLRALIEMDVGGMARVIAGPRTGVYDSSFGIGFTVGLAAGHGY